MTSNTRNPEEWLTNKLRRALHAERLNGQVEETNKLIDEIEQMISNMIAGNRKGKQRCTKQIEEIKNMKRIILGMEVEAKKLKNDHAGALAALKQARDQAHMARCPEFDCKRCEEIDS